MGACENETCYTAVVEWGKPAVHAVAGFAVQGKPGSLMIDRFRVQIIAEVTGAAIGSQPEEPPRGSFSMAALAPQRSMGAEQREPVPVSVRLVGDIAPPADTVAARAVGPHSAAVYVGVAVRTLCPDFRKYEAFMTVPAAGLFMHSRKLETGCFMIKIRIGPNGDKASC